MTGAGWEVDVSDDERRRWDERYRGGTYRPRSHPSPLLERWLQQLRVQGRALDLACGAGRNALFLAEAGYSVDAVDISEAALDLARAEAERRELEVHWSSHDLSTWTPPAERYDLITVFRYRSTSLWPRLAHALVPGGWLIVGHHLRSGAELDGPRTDEFRVAPQELLHAFADLRIVSYAEHVELEKEPDTGAERRFALAHVVACKGDPSTFGPAELASP